MSLISSSTTHLSDEQHRWRPCLGWNRAHVAAFVSVLSQFEPGPWCLEAAQAFGHSHKTLDMNRHTSGTQKTCSRKVTPFLQSTQPSQDKQRTTTAPQGRNAPTIRSELSNCKTIQSETCNAIGCRLSREGSVDSQIMSAQMALE